MSDPQQTKENHTRYHPIFHFFLLPAIVVLLVGAVYNLVRYPSIFSALCVLLVIVVAVIGFIARTNAIKVQDRLIRLEERIRLAALLPAHLQAAIPEFTERQLVALRFASDAELPLLAERSLVAHLDPKAIKAEIKTWRPDNWRV